MSDTQTTETNQSARRAMLGKAVKIAAGVVAAGVISPRLVSAVSPALKFANIPGTDDVKVLNYALALEDLEADLYAQATMRLTNGGTNKLGKKITGLNLNAGQPDVFYLREFGKVEAQHRDFLRGALGSAAISQFKYDFSMEKLSRKQVVDLVYTAEKTGVGAYLGAIKFFKTATYLQTAGAIQGTEARHTAVFAGVINRLFSEGLDVAPLAATNNGIDAPIDPDTVLAAVSPFIVVS